MDKVNEAEYQYLRSRGVKRLVHFTPAENLASILDNGICPRQYMEMKGIGYRCTDTSRADGKNGYTSYSVSFPNRSMLLNKMIDDKISFAILYIDVGILQYIESGRIIYCRSNAAKNRHWGNGMNYLKDMFCDSVTDVNGRVIRRSEMMIPEEYTTDPQAEILIHCMIPSDFIREVSILAVSEEDFNRIKSQKVNKTIAGLQLIQDSSVYTRNENIKRWSATKTI